MADELTPSRTVPAVKFQQWLNEWNTYNFDSSAFRRRPEENLYLFSMKAGDLRRLCAVYKREHSDSGAEGIQRYRDDQRTARIQQYIQYGYPYGDLPDRRRNSETSNLKKPGWLPTAIVLNILIQGDRRKGKHIQDDHIVSIEEIEESICKLVIPKLPISFSDTLAPFEVIDGQHRLWAFDESSQSEVINDQFELPVVAYRGLDIAWQAYLFWSINVSPKKINPSHAFDLYPLLRTEDWLDEVGEISVYREARAQELTRLMNDYPDSPWTGRINMLGEKGAATVSQAAWVRALLSTFFSTGRGAARPGLFQSNLPGTDEPLDWTRPQQAAFLIYFWRKVSSALESYVGKHWWIRQYQNDPVRAMTSTTSMLNQDQGVRGLLSVLNDIFYEYAKAWGLNKWSFMASGDFDDDNVLLALESIESQPFRNELVELADAVVRFDWRSSKGPNVTEAESREKRIYRGGGGYTALERDILKVVEDGEGHVPDAAAGLLRAGI